MYLLQIFLTICSFMTCLFLFGIAFRIMHIVFFLVVDVVKREPIDTENISNLIRFFPDYWNDKDGGNMGKAIIIMAIIGLFHFAIPYNSTQIGSFFEKSEYTEYYYVHLFPEYSQSKNYLVKAKIRANIEDYGPEDGSERHYHIEEAYFPNGGKITFNEYGDFETLRLEKKIYAKDDSGGEWEVVLTSNKADT